MRVSRVLELALSAGARGSRRFVCSVYGLESAMDNVCVADVATIGAIICFEAPVFAFLALSVYEGLAGRTSAASCGVADEGFLANARVQVITEGDVLFLILRAWGADGRANVCGGAGFTLVALCFATN